MHILPAGDIPVRPGHYQIIVTMGKKKDIILENVEIQAVAAEGKALAKVDGTVLFVQFAVPGDIVDVKVTRRKKNYMEG